MVILQQLDDLQRLKMYQPYKYSGKWFAVTSEDGFIRLYRTRKAAENQCRRLGIKTLTLIT